MLIHWFVRQADAGAAHFTNYLMWSSRTSMFINGAGTKLELLCNPHGVHHRKSGQHSSIRDGKWHELVFVFDGGTVNVYIDGTSVFRHSQCSSFLQNWRFGNHACEISKMTLWNRKLQAGEITGSQARDSKYPGNIAPAKFCHLC